MFTKLSSRVGIVEDNKRRKEARVFLFMCLLVLLSILSVLVGFIIMGIGASCIGSGSFTLCGNSQSSAIGMTAGGVFMVVIPLIICLICVSCCLALSIVH
jgi:nitrate reductase NapE component